MEFNKQNSQYLKIGNWLKVSATVEKGSHRENMEDRIMICDFPFEKKHYYLFLLLDGHGGSEVVDYVKAHFTSYFAKNVLLNKGRKIRRCISETFHQLDEDVKEFECGTTASLLLIVTSTKKNKLPEFWVANVGDSTVYGVIKENKKKKTKQKIRKISLDHKPSLPKEISRMKEFQSFKEVKDGYVLNTDGSALAISRALGDSDFGKAVTPEPTITKLGVYYDVYIMASDGIWDVMDGKAVWNLLNNPKELRAWRYSAGRLNHIRNQKYEQHDNTSLILLFANLDKYLAERDIEVHKSRDSRRDTNDSTESRINQSCMEVDTQQ
jgi:serine/threonine protein phosphatase PrpC